MDTNLVRRTGSRHFLASGVFIETDSEAIRLMAGSSNTDEQLKWDMIESINDFIDDPATSDYDQTFRGGQHLRLVWTAFPGFRRFRVGGLAVIDLASLERPLKVFVNGGCMAGPPHPQPRQLQESQSKFILVL